MDIRLLEDINEYQKKYKHFMVIKDFNKRGSFVRGYEHNIVHKYNATYMTCVLAANENLQIVCLGGSECLETYSEYSPYYVSDCSDVEVIEMVRSGEVPGEPLQFRKER